MPLLVPILIWFASSLAARMLLGLGLGIVTFYALQTLMDNLKNALLSSLSGLPADIVNIMGLLNFDFYISIVLSAMGTAAFIASSKIALGKT